MLTSELRQKGLSQTQAGIVTVFEAWRLFCPNAERPTGGHVIGWLRLASVDEIIELIEKSAGSRSPRHVVFSELQKRANMRN